MKQNKALEQGHIVEHLELPMADIYFADDYATQEEAIYYRNGLRYRICRKDPAPEMEKGRDPA